MTATAARVVERTASEFSGAPWEGVARALGRASSLDGLRIHRLHLLEAARLQELGRPIPDELAAAATSAVRAAPLARALLSLIREVCEGPILVLKGPEIAALYPSPWLRPYVDVDVLVTDAVAAERRLRAAGFQGVGPAMDWDALHHVQRLAAPGLLAAVEVHRRPKWLPDERGPSVDDLLAAAVPSATGVDGLLAPSPGHHAVLLGVHAWVERPLGRVGDLVDVAAAREAAPDESDDLARRYGVERIWRTTLGAIEAVLGDNRRTWATSTWARHLHTARERTVAETHYARLLEPFSSLPLRRVPVAVAHALGWTLLPDGDEGWPEKLERTRKALGSARIPISQHVEGVDAKRGEDR